MLHKFTALILSCLMLVLATTSQVGLSFCLCEKTMFVGDCPCAPSSTKSSNDHQTNQCSSGCCTKEIKHLTTTQAADTPPCNNCIVSLDWKLDQCTPQLSLDFKTSPESQLNPTFLIGATETAPLPNTSLQAIEIRGSPPPLATSPTVPLYIRHSVFLI